MTDERIEVDAGADFDAFWSTYGTRQTVRILGEDVPLPKDVPLWLVMKAEGTVQDETEVRRMVGVLYGDEVLDRWVAKGLGMRQLSIILAWTIARAQGATISFAEAAERVEKVMSDPPPSNRQQRRKKARKKS